MGIFQTPVEGTECSLRAYLCHFSLNCGNESLRKLPVDLHYQDKLEYASKLQARTGKEVRTDAKELNDANYMLKLAAICSMTSAMARHG
jgi:hypothetical protein